MELYPAIDLLGGRCVRLRKGRLDDVTVYDTDPVARAAAFEAQGAAWVHVVDLDRALETGHENTEAVAAICSDTGLRVQTGGGLRGEATCEEMLDAGADRIVLGTAVTEDPDLVERLADRHSGQIAAAIDTIEGEVAVRGWRHSGGVHGVTLAMRLQELGVDALLATDVSRDGMLTGPDIAGLIELLVAVDVPVLASGGVSSIDDLVQLARLEREGKRLAGVVVGKAIYERRFDVTNAIAAMRKASEASEAEDESA